VEPGLVPRPHGDEIKGSALPCSAILRAGVRKNLLKKVLSFPPAPPILFLNFLCSLFLFAFRKKKKRDKSLERIGAHGECKELISKMMAGNAQSAGRTALCKL
jgi:hypothetical protein